MQRFHSADLRKGRVDLKGQIYLLTTVTHERNPVFAEFALARTCISAMRYQQEQGRVKSLAFVVMPDHLHWLVELQNDSLAAVMKSVKGFVARELGNRKFWQAGFHDHALRRDEDVKRVARYLVANPVRAGLVDSVWQYPYWDAVWVE